MPELKFTNNEHPENFHPPQFLCGEKINNRDSTSSTESEQENTFPVKERNRGVKTEAFGDLSENRSTIMEKLKIRLKDKKYIVAGIGSEQFSLTNEEDKEIEYLLQYAADMHIPILFLTPIGTKNDDYFKEFHYQGSEHILATSIQMGIEIEFTGNLFSAEDIATDAAQGYKKIEDQLSKRFGKNQYIILTDGSPIVGGSKLFMRSLKDAETLVIDRKSKIDEVGDALEQTLGIEHRPPRTILDAHDYLADVSQTTNQVTVIYNLDEKELYLKALNKLKLTCDSRNDVPILTQSPTENSRLTNLGDLLNEIKNTPENDLLGKHFTIACYVNTNSK